MKSYGPKKRNTAEQTESNKKSKSQANTKKNGMIKLTPRAHNFVIDLKGELRDLTMVPGDGSIVIDPTDDDSWGIDPFYALDDSSSDTEIYKVMSTIAISLIPQMKGDNAFFSDQARELLKGCFVYFYARGYRTFTELLRQTLSQPIKQTIQEIIESADPGSPAYISVIDFAEIKSPEDGEKTPSIETSETVMNIFMNFKSKAAVLLADEDLARCLDKKDKAFYPELLLDHDVYFCVPKHRVAQYAQLCASKRSVTPTPIY